MKLIVLMFIAFSLSRTGVASIGWTEVSGAETADESVENSDDTFRSSYQCIAIPDSGEIENHPKCEAAYRLRTGHCSKRYYELEQALQESLTRCQAVHTVCVKKACYKYN